jgi:hypothetical protein
VRTGPFHIHRGRQLNANLESAELDFHLVVGAPFGSIGTVSTDRENIILYDDFKIGFAHSCDLHPDDILLVGLIDIGGGTPQAGTHLPVDCLKDLATGFQDRRRSADYSGHLTFSYSFPSAFLLLKQENDRRRRAL